jgi:hypothetical protein
LPVVENGGGNGAQGGDPHGSKRPGDTGGAGEGSSRLGRNVPERSGGASREARLHGAGERLQLRREVKQRSVEERQRAREEPKPPKGGSGAPPTEQELAEKREHHKLRIEEKRPEGHSRAPKKTPQELAEKHERQKRKQEERKRREREEEAAGLTP